MKLWFKYYLKCTMRWISKVAGIQCHGKRKNGFAYEWCQLRAFHDKECVFHDC